MSMTLTQFRANIRIGLADAATFWSNGEIDRAVERTEFLLARLIPKKNIVETTITIDRTAETLAISSDTGTTTYKPIKYDSETITNAAGTAMVRDTNYTINYMTGVITEIGSLLPDAADYAITYKQDTQRLDIGSLVINPVKITRVEYPVGDMPPAYLGSFDIIEDFLILHEEDILTGGKHLRIYYDSAWIAAGVSTGGEHPGHLDDAIVIGASGYCLIIKAEKYVQSSITELELVNAAADSMATPLADINVALDNAVKTSAGGALLAVTAALDKVAVYLETNVAGNSGTDNAVSRLGDITDEIAALRTAISTAHDAANTHLDEVDTTDLGQATVGAEGYLETGDDKITPLNVADRVAEKYADYARARVAIATARIGAALGFVEEANSRLATLRSYIEEAGGWDRIAEDFIAEATQRLGIVNAYLNEATQRVAEVNAWAVQADRYTVTSRQYLDIAGRYLASGQSKINEFYAMLGFRPELQHSRAAAGQPA